MHNWRRASSPLSHGRRGCGSCSRGHPSPCKSGRGEVRKALKGHDERNMMMSSETDNQAKQASAMASVAPSANWVGAWYAAPSRMLSAALSGRTLRQIVHLHAGGEQLRLRLSNRYGD